MVSYKPLTQELGLTTKNSDIIVTACEEPTLHMCMPDSENTIGYILRFD